MKYINVGLKKSTYVDFHKACIEDGTTMSDTIRKLIKEWLKNRKQETAEPKPPAKEPVSPAKETQTHAMSGIAVEAPEPPALLQKIARAFIEQDRQKFGTTKDNVDWLLDNFGPELRREGIYNMPMIVLDKVIKLCKSQ